MTDDNLPDAKPFALFLQEQPTGVHDEATEKLQELVQRCQETGGSGSLTLTIKVAPNGRRGSMTVKDSVKSSLPQHDRGEGMFFADDKGNLHRDDPRQQRLPLRGVNGRNVTVAPDGDGGEAHVDADTGEVLS